MLMLTSFGYAQQPPNCAVGGFTISPDDSIWVCKGAGLPAVKMVTGIPAGTMIFIDSGSCPSGYTENTALNGKTLIGTLAANGNVGQTGGSDVLTPAGTNAAISAGTPSGTNSAPTLTGSAWTPPVISWPAQVQTYTGTVNTLAVTAHTVVATKQGTAAGNVVTTATHAITGIPGGTVAWPAQVPTIGAYTPQGSISAPTFSGNALGTHTHTFTGTPGDNRSAFVYLSAFKKS